jgi:hypothetical protein
MSIVCFGCVFNDLGLPFSFDVDVVPEQETNESGGELRGQMRGLLDAYGEYEHRINLEECFVKETGARRIDKMVSSLRGHGYGVAEGFWTEVQGMLKREEDGEK